MKKINKDDQEVRRQEWEAMVQECRSSGKSVKRWCKEKGINIHTYYNRMNKLKQGASAEEKPEIVPVSTAEEIRGVSETEERKPETVVMRKNGLEIEIPENIREETLLLLLRGMLEC